MQKKLASSSQLAAFAAEMRGLNEDFEELTVANTILTYLYQATLLLGCHSLVLRKEG